MRRQVLILNVTRMGDLIQMGTLLARLRYEWPDVEIDVVVDRQFESTARLLPGIRTVHPYDFDRLVNDCRAMSRDVVELYRAVKRWATPLTKAGYDRLINLTFTRRSGLLAKYLQVPDIRGVVSAPDGSTSIRDPWLSYFTDLHHYRRFNRFNLVDLYALGGSGPGPHAPLSLRVTENARRWVDGCLGGNRPADGWVAVQIGASEAIKAWRPASFGQTMAKLSRRASIGFVLIGTQAERAAVLESLAEYRRAGGTAAILDFVDRTPLPQLIALLARARLLLTNDTGPMHIAVAVGTPVIDLSVGHVDFRETGPYGHGHWVVQPDLECAPCGFDRVCLHHACKDRVDVDELAELVAHVLGRGELPQLVSGVKLFQSEIDEDGLVRFRQRAGRIDAFNEWYGAWWRRYWYAELVGQPMQTGAGQECPPDRSHVEEMYRHLEPLIGLISARVADLNRAATQVRLRATDLQELHRSLTEVQRRIGHVTEASRRLVRWRSRYDESWRVTKA